MSADPEVFSLSAAIEQERTDGIRYRSLAAELARKNFGLALQIERLEQANRALGRKCARWRECWAWSYGGNLLVVAAIIGYVIIHWILN